MASYEIHLIHIGGESDSDTESTEQIYEAVNAIRGNAPNVDPTDIIRPIFSSDDDSEEDEDKDEDIEDGQESENEDLEEDLVEEDKDEDLEDGQESKSEDLEEDLIEGREDNQESESEYFFERNEFELYKEESEEENPSYDNVLCLLNQMCEDMLITEKMLRKVAVRQETVKEVCEKLNVNFEDEPFLKGLILHLNNIIQIVKAQAIDISGGP
ncbi:glutamic acid-rich protein-like [Macadamia integrifolia]|uniref:glutamic acid-rich protein-like n=1 Tax=Macadamia integrifolia TaxID=60698 RepID=UPI001C500A65|nr:glutamic acid-rich protein-like [Macadamia integrifolia]